MSMSPRSILPLLVLLMGLAGCGEVPAGDDSPPKAARESSAGTKTSGLQPPTRQEFIARADAICERMVSDAKPLKGTSNDEAFARALALQGRALRELRALTPPPGDERRVNDVLLHLERLQRAMSALEKTEGEEVLAVVAAIGVEMDAVARAANRYGLFRSCGAWEELPGIQRIVRGQGQDRILRGPDGKPLARRGSAPIRPPASPPAQELRGFASALVPSGRRVVSRQFCGGGAPEALPTCVILELAPQDKSLAIRHAEVERLAARSGWKKAKRVDGRWSPGALVLFRDDYHASVTLASPKCREQTQRGDGPDPKATLRRCLDRIMVLRSV